METAKYGLLSQTVFNLWQFFMTGCTADQRFFCKVRSKELPAGEIFLRTRHYIFVRPDSLPLDADVKAVAINTTLNNGGGRMYFEFTLLDWAVLKKKLAEMADKYSHELEIRGKGFFWQGRKIMATSSRCYFRKVSSYRTVLYTVDDLRDTSMEPLIQIADLIYNNNCFSETEVPSISIGGQTFTSTQIKLQQVQTMEMRQAMQQLITREQQPVMIMALRQQARLFQSQRILRLSSQELASHVDSQLATNPALEEK